MPPQTAKFERIVLPVVVHAKGNHQMKNQEADGRKLLALIAFVPAALPHYWDDLKTQRRVGTAISAAKQPPDFRIRTIWL